MTDQYRRSKLVEYGHCDDNDEEGTVNILVRGSAVGLSYRGRIRAIRIYSVPKQGENRSVGSSRTVSYRYHGEKKSRKCRNMSVWPRHFMLLVGRDHVENCTKEIMSTGHKGRGTSNLQVRSVTKLHRYYQHYYHCPEISRDQLSRLGTYVRVARQQGKKDVPPKPSLSSFSPSFAFSGTRGEVCCFHLTAYSTSERAKYWYI